MHHYQRGVGKVVFRQRSQSRFCPDFHPDANNDGQDRQEKAEYGGGDDTSANVAGHGCCVGWKEEKMLLRFYLAEEQLRQRAI